ncbi:uncharacterized protein [Chelonus insularis]|uniref:uncharacterized protein n=1 Tax=Chelonus insularis TaxID=460826 RepID=UPI00158A5044|nr:uncharacterized protein LOC118073653 [Chelonus insularis]
MAPRKKSLPQEFSSATKKKWDEDEKTTLLSALQKYGYTDIDNIAKEFPHKTKAAVRAMINKLYAIAQKSNTTQSDHIDAWLESEYFSNTNTMIPEALRFISLFEDHPPPEDSAGCDFKALYDLLHRATLGQPFINSTPMTLETIFYILKQITEEVWPKCEEEVDLYLENLLQQKTRKVYGPKKMKNTN